MKRKILWMLVSWLIVVAFVLSSCGEAVPGEQEEEEEEEEEEPVAGAPQYGGTLTLWGSAYQASELPNPDMDAANYSSLWWLNFIQEDPLIGDTEQYGPRGTGEYAFQTYYNIPAQYLKGNLVESWELSLDRIVFHVRPGIYWAPNEEQSAWMEARELTAEDIALDLKRFFESAWNLRFEGMTSAERVHVIDRYTLEIEFENFSHVLIYYIGYEDRAKISPPEMEIAGAGEWANQVGTGPYMFEEYAVGSHMSYVRNPNYWDTTTINGVTYQMPFMDRVVLPIIPDESTRIAAVKTGVIELHREVPFAHWDTLDKAAPQMLKTNYSPGTGSTVGMRSDLPPFNDVKVRRALHIGTDAAEFSVLNKAEGLPIDFQPFMPNTPPYTPLEELPADIQLLYDYNPELAKKMLAEAGYPEGFKTEIAIGITPAELDNASLLKDQWAKIGVEVEIKVLDPVALVDAVYPLPVPAHTGIRFDKVEAANPIIYFSQFFITAEHPGGGGSANRDVYSNSEFDDLMDRVNLELDVAEQTRLLEEAGDILRQDVLRIPLYLVCNRTYWWPWVKNYYGEATIADDASFCPLVRYMWIDEDLKAKMGY